MVFESMPLARQHTFTIVLPSVLYSGALHTRLGMLVMFQMSLISEYLDARHICICLLANGTNLMPRPLRSRLSGMSRVLKVADYGIKIPTPSICLEM
jgi:hypothetical protein